MPECRQGAPAACARGRRQQGADSGTVARKWGRPRSGGPGRSRPPALNPSSQARLTRSGSCTAWICAGQVPAQAVLPTHGDGRCTGPSGPAPFRSCNQQAAIWFSTASRRGPLCVDVIPIDNSGELGARFPRPRPRLRQPARSRPAPACPRVLGHPLRRLRPNWSAAAACAFRRVDGTSDGGHWSHHRCPMIACRKASSPIARSAAR